MFLRPEMKAAAIADIPARIARVREWLRHCALCPRACGVDRIAGETGVCRLGAEARCFREMIGYNEEKVLTPSHQLYFSGCNLNCRFCTVKEWNENPDAAMPAENTAIAAVVRRRRREGARTLNLLGGEPGVSLCGILELLQAIPSDTCVIWNTNLYFSPVVFDLLDGLVGIYLADFKCGNDDCAERLLGATDYMRVVTANLAAAARHGTLIVRHLLLPGHEDCCFEPLVRWMAAEMPGIPLSIRGNYVPPAGSGDAPTEFLHEKDLASAGELAASFDVRTLE